jgi:hypothetical protein
MAFESYCWWGSDALDLGITRKSEFGVYGVTDHDLRSVF